MPRAAQLGVLWIGIQAAWGALLGIALPSRAIELAPHAGVFGYALLASSGAAVAALVQIAIGPLADRLHARSGNRRIFYLVGISITLPALALFYLVTNYAALIATFAFVQIGMNLLMGPYQAVIPDHLDETQSGRSAAWMSAYQFCGSVIGLATAAFAPPGLTMPILIVLLAVTFAITYTHLRRLKARDVAAQPFRFTRDIMTVLISRGFINLGFYTLFGFLLFFVQETLHVEAARTTTGILFIEFTVAAVVGALLAGRPADALDKRVVVSFAALAIAIAVIVFASAGNVAIAMGAAIGSGIAWGAFFTADWAIAFVVLPRGAMASAMAVWNIAAVIPQILAPVITAPLVHAIDMRFLGLGPRVALALVAVEFVIGAAWLWRLQRIGASPSHDF